MVAGLGGGVLFLFSSSVANTGGDVNGILGSRREGQLQLGHGNIYIDTNIGSAANMRIKCAEDSAIIWQGGGIFRGLAASGIFFDGGNSVDLGTIAAGTLSLVFENQSGTASCTSAFIINSLDVGSGYNYYFPEANGEITGNYLVEAKNGAQVVIDSSTSVTTATVSNAVSADSGTSASSRSTDGTFIQGGTPAANARWRKTTRVTASPYTILATDDSIYVDTDGGVITVNLPVGVNSASYRIINVGSSTNNVTVVPNGSELLLGANSTQTITDSNILTITYETTEGWW